MRQKNVNSFTNTMCSFAKMKSNIKLTQKYRMSNLLFLQIFVE